MSKAAHGYPFGTIGFIRLACKTTSSNCLLTRRLASRISATDWDFLTWGAGATERGPARERTSFHMAEWKIAGSSG